MVIGRVVALDRLRPSLPDARFELRAIEDFLAGYSRVTLAGEEQLRAMERLYASLRGRLIVRLMCVNLNPEELKRSGNPFEALQNDWMEIERRLEEFLRERKNERIDFVTLLITEEGEWTGSHREWLEKLSNRDERNSCFRMRCYLMTRLLELGHKKVIHAKDVWPDFAACLLRHFLWRSVDAGGSRDAQTARFFDQQGLFAWRTLRVVAKIPDKALRQKFRDVVLEINKRFFGGKREPLFPDALIIPETNASAFEAPVENPVRGGAWNQPEKWLEALEATEQWRSATEDHARNAGRSGWGGLREDYLNSSSVRNPSASMMESRLQADEAGKSPDRLFPGELPIPAIVNLADSATVLTDVGRGVREVEAQTNEFREWWQDHLKAGKGFVIASERWIVGAIVGMALVYGIMSIQLVIQRYLPDALFPLSRGLMLAACSLAGVAAMLTAGYLTQRWRGRHAHRMLGDKADQWINTNKRLRQTIADSMESARARGSKIREAAARRQLVDRLKRIELVLLSELQPGTADNDSSGFPDTPEEERMGQQQLLEVRIPDIPKDFDTDTLAAQATEGFFSGWKQMLAGAGPRAMIPVPDVLGLCRKALESMKRDLEEKLSEKSVEQLRNLESGDFETRIRLAFDQAEADGNRRNFYSVDLQGGSPRDSVWYRKGFEKAFPCDGVEWHQEIPEERADAGLLGLWFGECPVRIGMPDAQDRLRFEVDYVRGKQGRDAGSTRKGGKHD